MHGFADFSLPKRTDELLRPSEKGLEKEFKSRDNQRVVHGTVVTEIDPGASFRSVMEVMDAVFRSAISTDSLPTVDEMNSTVYGRISESLSAERVHRARFVERTFENSNVPRSFLPRPSMSLDDGPLH